MKKFRLWLLRYLLKGSEVVLVADTDLYAVLGQLRTLEKNIEVHPHFANSRSNRVYRMGQKIRGQINECIAILSLSMGRRPL